MDSSTPITSQEIEPILSFSPSGSLLPKSSLRTVSPRMQTADPGISKTYTPMMMAMNTSQGTLTPGGDGPASAVAIVMALIAGVLAMIYALVERKANEQ